MLLEWIQLLYDRASLFVQSNIQKPRTQKRSESGDIDENNIFLRLGETFGIFRRMAAEWGRVVFVYDEPSQDKMLRIW